MNKHFKQALDYSVVGSMGLVVVSALGGCQDKSSQSQYEDSQNQFFVIEEKTQGNYTVIEQYPTTGETRAVLKQYNGKERVITEAEIKELMQAEAPKIEDGTSNLTSNNGGGMSLGETLMAAAGGALIGSMIGNALGNRLNKNQNFQNRSQSARRTSGFSRSVNSRPKSTSRTSSSRSGFFGSKGRASSRSSGFFGG